MPRLGPDSEAAGRVVRDLVGRVGLVVVQECEERAVPRALPGVPVQERPVDVRGTLGVLPRDRDQGAGTAAAAPQSLSTSMATEKMSSLRPRPMYRVKTSRTRERIVIIVGKAPGHARLAAEIIEVGDKPGRVIAERTEPAGERGLAVVERRLPSGRKLVGPPPGKEARV